MRSLLARCATMLVFHIVLRQIAGAATLPTTDAGFAASGTISTARGSSGADDAGTALPALTTSATNVNVTTFHGDAQRTGWSAHETALTPANVPGKLRVLARVTVDEQVDAQPLVVTGVTINGVGREVVYVATENDTVYALDAASGATLWARHLGAPIPRSALPSTCVTNGPFVGITATPVADTYRHALYVLADTYEFGKAVFRLRALDLGSGVDRIAPRTVTASHRLANGSTYAFDANVSRSRAALLDANGSIYAGFASYCDASADRTRGWVLGWSAGTLVPLAASGLDNIRTSAPYDEYLASVWMAGSGIAADQTGTLFFTTGNADRAGTSYDGVTEIGESMVRASGDLTKILDLFTPYDWSTLDRYDTDFGSGGVLVIPDQPGSVPRLASAAGKNGKMYLVNRDRLGGYRAGGPDAVLGTYAIGGCWCAQSYFRGSDGVGRIVTSGGHAIEEYVIQTGTGIPSLKLIFRTAALPTGQDPGFYTTVSSNGTVAYSSIVWAVTKPRDANPAYVYLYAFDATTGKMLYGAVAGSWPNSNANADLVPVVANGRVYVASNKRLTIFGLK